ncbi:UNVERIFIED_CONTAM: hypothetical protein GTU68_058209 [Idotea baltica]|nr:hypothetical protein [Idotea baltica]
MSIQIALRKKPVEAWVKSQEGRQPLSLMKQFLNLRKAWQKSQLSQNLVIMWFI